MTKRVRLRSGALALVLLTSAPVASQGGAASTPIMIDQGTVGVVGDSSIGVISVNGSADQTTVVINLDLYARGVPIESTMRPHKGDWGWYA